MKISQLIFFGFLFILLLFSFTTYINFRQSEAVKDNAEYVTTSSNIVRQSNRFQRNILNIVSGLRGYLVTGERSFIQTYDSAVLENDAILKELQPLVSDDSAQSALLQGIVTLRQNWLEEFALPLAKAKSMSTLSDSSMRAFNRLYREQFLSAENNEIHQRLQAAIRTFINNEYSRREARKLVLASSIQETRRLSFLLTIASIVAGFVIAAWLAFTISRRILAMVGMLNTIATGNYKVRMNDRRRDELGRLSQSLDHMAGVLDENFTLLKRKNEELDQFAHIVSHDLKAPLRGIDNVISWIDEDHGQELAPKVHEYLGLVKGRIVRAENLIGGILSYARVGKEEHGKENVSVAELVNEIAGSLALASAFRIEVSPSLPVLQTERVPLLQVFQNLLSNAVKYNDKPDGLARVWHEEDGDKYRFFVSDNGPGIAPHYQQRIFVIFQTLQERDSFESTGVGLAIVKKVLDARNETITLQSTPGGGATFSFTWPKN
jgi:signal transduction histidine kinase